MQNLLLIQAVIGTIWFILTLLIGGVYGKFGGNYGKEEAEKMDNIFITNYVLSFAVGWTGWFCLSVF
jgi:hypothetical protein